MAAPVSAGGIVYSRAPQCMDGKTVPLLPGDRAGVVMANTPVAWDWMFQVALNKQQILFQYGKELNTASQNGMKIGV